MPFLAENYWDIKNKIAHKAIEIIAVSKTKTIEEIYEAYEAGIRDFGENYVQELVEKYEKLPKDIRWHFIGHLQSNKVKYIAPFVYLIHGVDSEKLLLEINKQGKKNNKTINCLIQMHIAQEETKYGFNETELESFVEHTLNKNDDNHSAISHVKIIGMMGMASFSDNFALIRKEFNTLYNCFKKYQSIRSPHFELSILSMGMSSDYPIAIEEGSNMIRIGSILFGKRN